MTIGTDRLFGGCLSALLDDVTGHAAAELSVSYFRPCLPSDGELLLEGFVINQSRRSLHIEATVRRADGKLLARRTPSMPSRRVCRRLPVG